MLLNREDAMRAIAVSPRLWPLVLASLICTLSCSSKQQAAPAGAATRASASAPAAQQPGLESTDADAAEQKTALVLPKTFGRFTGDWDEIVKRGQLRALVVYNRGGFYYDKGHPRGLNVEAMEEFAKVMNQKLKTGAKKFTVGYISIPPGQLLQALNDGVGDLICSGVIVTPEREKLVDFTTPIADSVKLVIVTGKNAPAIRTIDDLSGKDVYINPISVAGADLQSLNQKFEQAGKAKIAIHEVDNNLTESDILDMINAGLLPATVTNEFRAQMWSHVYPDIVITPVVVRDQGTMAWVMRKGSPQLKAVMDEFLVKHKIGTTFGNMMVQKYIKNPKAMKDSTSEAELAKFNTLVKYFQQYATEYNFDYLMVAAQAYQESMLNQDRVSPRGAVGVMQVLPKYAAANPINIPNVRNPQDNIHAGTKMLAQITKTYFNDPNISQVDKTLFTFAAYNAGPNRIARLRKAAADEGLDPNKWFGNVELMAAKDIGQETVQYVGNIYKYYVAYKLTTEQIQLRQQAKQQLKAK
jgi:membrane-bound lytic murein transglycosylase MltF